ncbi:hypothetical protein ACSBR2_038839 [Camellia fascicularis]
METRTTESLWVLFLTSKSKSLSPENITFILVALFCSWLIMTLLYWAHPGGPAWGKQGWKRRTKAHGPIIPGPRGVPVLGSMALMASLAHRRLAATAELFGAKRLMAFSLGETRVIVTSNLDVPKEILTSPVFADRPAKQSAYSLMFNRAIGFAPYGVYWRTLMLCLVGGFGERFGKGNEKGSFTHLFLFSFSFQIPPKYTIRKIASTHLFCAQQISNSEARRFEIANQMITVIAGLKGEFSVRDILKRASLNNMICSVSGRECQLGSDESDELSRLVEEGYELLGKLNWGDHLPWLAGLDLQKVGSRCSKLVPKVNRFVNRIISEHRDRAQALANQDFVDVLLSLHGPDKVI